MTQPTNSLVPPTSATDELETRHFNLTRELFELRALRRKGLPSGQDGHLKKRAQEFERELEQIELLLDAARLEVHRQEHAEPEPPRSKAFLQSFYSAARKTLPKQLLTQLEAAAAKERNCHDD